MNKIAYWMKKATDAGITDPENRWNFYEKNVEDWDFETPTDEEFQKARQDNDIYEWVDSHLEEIF